MPFAAILQVTLHRGQSVQRRCGGYRTNRFYGPGSYKWWMTRLQRVRMLPLIIKTDEDAKKTLTNGRISSKP